MVCNGWDNMKQTRKRQDWDKELPIIQPDKVEVGCSSHPQPNLMFVKNEYIRSNIFYWEFNSFIVSKSTTGVIDIDPIFFVCPIVFSIFM